MYRLQTDYLIVTCFFFRILGQFRNGSRTKVKAMILQHFVSIEPL